MLPGGDDEVVLASKLYREVDDAELGDTSPALVSFGDVNGLPTVIEFDEVECLPFRRQAERDLDRSFPDSQV